MEKYMENGLKTKDQPLEELIKDLEKFYDPINKMATNMHTIIEEFLGEEKYIKFCAIMDGKTKKIKGKRRVFQEKFLEVKNKKGIDSNSIISSDMQISENYDMATLIEGIKEAFNS